MTIKNTPGKRSFWNSSPCIFHFSSEDSEVAVRTKSLAVKRIVPNCCEFINPIIISLRQYLWLCNSTILCLSYPNSQPH